MVKKTKASQRSRRAPRRTSATKTKPGALQTLGRLDTHALAFRRLLLDPCGAPFTSPPYSGMGTGNFVRLRTTAFIPGNNTSGVMVFQPGRNLAWTFGTTSNSDVAFSNAAAIFSPQVGPIANGSQIRCVAGCVRVRYTGPESSRSGLVGLITGPPYFSPGTTLNGTKVSTLLHTAPVVNRTGEVTHEVKFMPMSGDENFDTSGTFDPEASTLTLLYHDCPANSLFIEVTCVLEYEHLWSNLADGNIQSAIPAPSANTLNHVLRTLGPATEWAYSNVAAPVIRAAAGYATNVMKSAVPAASTAALKYLTLV